MDRERGPEGTEIQKSRLRKGEERTGADYAGEFQNRCVKCNALHRKGITVKISSDAGTLVGVDIGGTFTDFFMVKGDKTTVFKLPSNPAYPGQPLIEGLEFLEPGDAAAVTHGSTVAINAVLENKTAETALISTKGFKDIVAIGRQSRSELYDLFFEQPEELVSSGLRFGVTERVNCRGEIVTELDLKEVQEVVFRIGERKAAAAVCFLFSFLEPRHEKAVGELLEKAGISCCLSCEVLPEFREYERTTATILNASLKPVMDGYLKKLTQSSLFSRFTDFRIMQSNGGTIPVQAAREFPVKTLFSGPAAGVIGAFSIAETSNYKDIITFDMGGTSTDVCLCPGKIRYTREFKIAGHPLAIPMIDIHSVGTGGGSLAKLEKGAFLRVGPQSAGADPGPACYGKGKNPTVTDANLVLGRIIPRFFMGGKMKLYPERSRDAVKKLGDKMGLSLKQAAEGIIKVAVSSMGRAVKVVSVQKGYDVRNFTLFAYGGAGGLHAAELAESAGITRVVIPPHPGILSAVGLAVADARRDAGKTVMKPLSREHYIEFQECFGSLMRGLEKQLINEGHSPESILFQLSADMRYKGQSHELTVEVDNPPYFSAWDNKFHETHLKSYACFDARNAIEVVTLRVTAVVRTVKPDLQKLMTDVDRSGRSDQLSRQINSSNGPFPVRARNRLAPGEILRGPSVIVSPYSTVYLPEKWRLSTDGHQNIVMELNE